MSDTYNPDGESAYERAYESIDRVIRKLKDEEFLTPEERAAFDRALRDFTLQEVGGESLSGDFIDDDEDDGGL